MNATSSKIASRNSKVNLNLLIGKKHKVFHFTHRSITESGRLKVDTFPPVPSGTTRMFGLKEIIECFRVVEIVEVV